MKISSLVRVPSLAIITALVFGSFCQISSAWAATDSDPTDLFIENITINPYSLELTFTAGNRGGLSGYGVFGSQRELEKNVKNSYVLSQGGVVLYTYTQEWYDSTSQYATYYGTNSKAEISTSAFGNRALPYVQTGAEFTVTVCLDATYRIAEPDELNCASVNFTYNTNPEGDPDGDLLTNQQESVLGTDANNPDTDGDGVRDDLESLIGTSPLLFDTDTSDNYPSDAEADYDHDGLSNLFELTDTTGVGGEGGNPASDDTDEDGIKDGQDYMFMEECGYSITQADGNHDGTDDALQDCDGDGVLNGLEDDLATDPSKADSDGDYYTDGEEVSYNTNPLDQSSQPGDLIDTDGDNVPDNKDRDDDGDGVRDVTERTNGTSPRDVDTDDDGKSDRLDTYPLDATR